MLNKYYSQIKEYLDNIINTLKLELDKEINNLFNSLEI